MMDRLPEENARLRKEYDATLSLVIRENGVSVEALRDLTRERDQQRQVCSTCRFAGEPWPVYSVFGNKTRPCMQLNISVPLLTQAGAPLGCRGWEPKARAT
jgi:hypothetical protein